MIEPCNVTLEQCIAVLDARRRLLSLELQEYTRPVPACDVDFNSLLAERARLTVALSQLLPMFRGEVRPAHPREDLAAH